MDTGLVTALAVVAQILSPSPGTPPGEAAVREGRELYSESCISCHGEQGQGKLPGGPPQGAGGIGQGAGPPLAGVGAASVHFYLSTGYMPLSDAFEMPSRSAPQFDREEINALIAYIDSLGGEGEGRTGPIPSVRPEHGSVSEGLELFAEHCAGCHQMVGEGGVLSEGTAPELKQATPTQIGEAIRVGPYTMPRFSEREISDEQVDSLAAYIEYTKDPRDEGGWGIGHIGPIPEGFAAWLIAGLGLVGVARLIGKRISTGGE